MYRVCVACLLKNHILHAIPILQNPNTHLIPLNRLQHVNRQVETSAYLLQVSVLQAVSSDSGTHLTYEVYQKNVHPRSQAYYAHFLEKSLHATRR